MVGNYIHFGSCSFWVYCDGQSRRGGDCAVVDVLCPIFCSLLGARSLLDKTVHTASHYYIHLYFATTSSNKYNKANKNTSHTRTVVRECFKGDEASQWKRPKFDPSPHQNPLTDLHTNWQAWLHPGRHPAAKFCSDRFRGFCSRNTWFCRAFGVTSMFVFWVLQKSYSLHPERIFTQNTRKDVVPCKEVPFGGHDDYI